MCVCYYSIQYFSNFKCYNCKTTFDQQVAVCFSISNFFFFKSEGSVYYIQRGLYIYNVILFIFMLAMKIFSGVS